MAEGNHGARGAAGKDGALTMTEYWEKTEVRGTDEEKRTWMETVLHRRGADPMVMAFRRNQGLAGCGRVQMETVEVFIMDRAEERRRVREDIPRDGRQDEAEWEW